MENIMYRRFLNEIKVSKKPHLMENEDDRGRSAFAK